MAIRLIIAGWLIGTLSPLAMAAQETMCRYSSNADEGSMVIADRCGEVTEAAGLSLLPEVRERLYHDADGLSCVILSRDEGWLVHRDGRAARGPVIDTNCPWFEEGLTIGLIEGRQVYMDKGLKVVLDPGYESLRHFEGGYAQVCNGPFTREQVGEKTRVTGGKCGMLDRSGKLVMELVHPLEEYAAFNDFRNAHNGCPPPPIEVRSSALCHAQRHAFRDNWTFLSVEPVADRWEVVYSFRDPARNRMRTYVMHLGREKAEVREHGEQGLRR
jgi:hypothetical protein